MTEAKERTKRLNVQVTLQQHTDLKVESALQGISITEYVVKALDEKLKKDKKKRGD